ncbi:MAG: hypothetical protein ACYC96_12850 [Fimbriimonadaceae bacterium]
MRSDIEAGAPNLDELRGGLGCFRRLLRDLDEPAILRELASRFAYIGDCANRRIEIGRVLREIPASVRGRILSDAALLADVAVSTRAKDQAPDEYWNREALDDALSDLARVYARDRIDFKELVEVESSKMQVNDAARLRRIVKDVANGLGHTGIEQGESMRAARNEVLDLVSDAPGDRSAFGWLMLGWLCLWNSAYSADAVSHFSQGIAVAGDSRSYLSHLLHRFLGMALEAGGRHVEALETAKTGLAMRPCADLALEASRYAIQCGRGAEAKQLFEAAVREAPMHLFVALADPDMAGLESIVVAEYGRAGAHMRQCAMRAIEEWKAMLARVDAAQRALGETIELPFELADGLEAMLATVQKSDVLEAIGVRSAIKRTTAELYHFVLRRITSAASQREAEAVAARGPVTESEAKRDSVKRTSKAQAETLIAQAEGELRRQVGTTSSAGALGSGVGGSLAMLVAYAVMAGIMGPRGVDTGIDSPFGMAGVCLIAAPLVLGFGAGAAGGLKQAVLASEIERRAAYARVKAKATLVEVEKACTLHAEGSKTAALTFEARARAASEALRVLREGPVPEHVSLDPRSASKLAA